MRRHSVAKKALPPVVSCSRVTKPSGISSPGSTSSTSVPTFSADRGSRSTREVSFSSTVWNARLSRDSSAERNVPTTMPRVPCSARMMTLMASSDALSAHWRSSKHSTNDCRPPSVCVHSDSASKNAPFSSAPSRKARSCTSSSCTSDDRWGSRRASRGPSRSISSAGVCGTMLRSACATGASGASPSARHWPRPKGSSASFAWSSNSWSSRVLPTPAGPPTSTARDWPQSASARPFISPSSSASRPTTSGTCR
ncbi:hypothetical protein COSO111634_30850 [Corallococcus soli]